MKIHILPDKEMKRAGFFEHENKWAYIKEVASEVSFTFRIIKDTGNWQIDIIDDDFGQPYDYQYILQQAPDHAFANTVKENVEDLMMYMVEEGIISDYEVGDYI